MTGELTLTGRVLPIGGLKEKLIAARRSKVNVLIFPKENLRDYDELPEYLKKGLEVHFVEYYDEVFRIAFPDEKIHAKSAASEKKLIEPQNLEKKCSALRARHLTIATLNGSFDLLHAGHLYIIYQALLQADRLILALNTDRSIQQYKSQSRPIVPLQYRLEMIAALEFVDFVTWFDETDPRDVLQKIKPDVHVNGVEYGENCIEAEVVKTLNARLHLVDRIPTLSTSSLIEKIKRCE